MQIIILYERGMSIAKITDDTDTLCLLVFFSHAIFDAKSVIENKLLNDNNYSFLLVVIKIRIFFKIYLLNAFKVYFKNHI